LGALLQTPAILRTNALLLASRAAAMVNTVVAMLVPGIIARKNLGRLGHPQQPQQNRKSALKVDIG